MKKTIIFMFATALIFSFINLEAKEKQEIDFFAHWGVVTDDSLSFSPFLWTAGVNIDIHLGDMLMLSPEGFITCYKFEFDPFWLAPGVLLNIKMDSFFIGGGVTKWILIGDGYTVSTDVAFKMNAGFRSDRYKLTAFAVSAFDNMFKDMQVGVTLGIRF
ncbi:MAG: hypothetical protein GY765_44145 [bacterium]|nr:hypothetical protein [bacterium]